MKKTSTFRMASIFAGSYIATIIGSGFATGQEIYQFFTAFGMSGLVGSIIAAILFTLAGMELLYRGNILKVKDPIKIYNFYCGKKLGKFLEIFIPLYLFGIYVIMISGAGATLEEYYRLDPYVGRILMSILVLFSVGLGIKKIMNILGNIGPVIILFTIIVSLAVIFKNMGNLDQSLEIYQGLEINKPAANGFLAGVLYPGYNIIVVVGLLAGMGSTTEDRKSCILGGLLGGAGLGITIILLYMAMLFQIGDIHDLAIPTLYMARQISPMFSYAFSIILMLGIYTSAVPLLYQAVIRLAADGTKKFKLIVAGAVALGFVLGLTPFEVLVGTIYPYTGYLGIIVMAMIIIKVVKLKISGEDGRGEYKEL